MNNKKRQIWFPLLFSISMVIGMFIGYTLRDKMPWTSTITGMGGSSSLDEVLHLVEERYVDSVKTDSLQTLAVNEVLKGLDPHSIYIPAKELLEVNEDLAGRFEGIGVEFNIIQDTLHVLNVFKGGPSEVAGLASGDKIITVDGNHLSKKGLDAETVKKTLRGPRGSEVMVRVLREGKTFEKKIIRGFIPLYALDAAYLLDRKTGYIRLNKFSETAYEEFMEALERLQKSGMENLVLDLRDNGGGILSEAVEMADEFLSGEKLIVYTEGRKNPKNSYQCRRRGLFETGQLVLLMDEGSASASEVLAGALQDWGRATIVGRRSFGKGLVQEQYDLSDGSALRLTVARYYTPLGRSIQKPYDEGRRKYNEDLSDRYHNGEMFIADSMKQDKGKTFIAANGKKLFGGGGIMPDVFVPYDTTRVDSIFSALYSKNTLGRFVYEHYISHRSTYAGFTSPEAFSKAFQADAAFYQQFSNYAKKDSIEITGISAKDKAFLGKRLKMLLARQIWRNEGFYVVANADDPVVSKAIEVMQSVSASHK